MQSEFDLYQTSAKISLLDILLKSFIVSLLKYGMVLMIRWYDHMAVGQYGNIGIDGNG